MSNLIDYLQWRGDITMEERLFCDVDQLIFSELSYISWAGVLPEVDASMDDGKTPYHTDEVTIADACERYLRKIMPVKPEEEESQAVKNKFVKLLGESARFGNLTLFNYVDRLDEEGADTDFSAVTIRLTEDTVFTVYRGTMDSIVGWKEDFCMSYQVIPAQVLAKNYLEYTVDDSVKHLYVGGHSKGGNLALYASAMCEDRVQDKILKIYSNDGPGLCSEVVPEEKIDLIRSRLVRIVPEFSVFGALFETRAETMIVKSSASNVMQHAMESWQIEGDVFETCSKHSEDVNLINNIFSRWIEQENLENREAFVNSFFTALENNGITGLKDLGGAGIDDIMTILLSATQSDDKTRNTVFRFVRTAFSALGSVNFDTFIREKESLQAVGMFVLGLIISLYPGQAIRFVGIVIGIAGTVYLGKHLLNTAFDEKGSTDARKMKMVLQMAGMCILMYLVAEKGILLKMSNLFIGVSFLIFAYRWLMKAFTYKELFPKKFLSFVIAGVSFAAGMVPLVISGVEMNEYMIGVGALIWLYAIGKFVYLAYKNGKKNKR